MNTFATRNDPRADELLAIRCQLGERGAFDALISRWHDPLWCYLRRLATSDDVARDLAQDTWIRVLRGIASLREPARFRPWLFGIARRVAMDGLRAWYAQGRHEPLDPENFAAPDPDANLEEEFATLDSGVASLPLVERETLTLFYLRELSLDEIAGLTSVPVGTVKSRLHRARQMLRKTIETKGAGS